MKFRLTSKFGALEEVRNGRVHTGIDLGTPMNTELRSIGEGVVEKVFDGTGAIGKGVKIELENGTHAIYGHMNDVSVKVGEKVHTGEFLGLSGNTGHSTGPHLHFALNRNGEFIDPTPIADELADISGSGVDPVSLFTIKSPLTSILGEGAKETIKENAKATTKEIIFGALEAVGEVIMDCLYGVTLVGTGVMIILRVVGYKPADKYIGLLPTTFVLLRYLFGGA